MKILSPSVTAHELILIPRYYFSGDVALVLSNEETKETITFTLTPITIDGYVYLNFDYQFINNQNFQIKVLSDTEEIVFRGKLFITDQITNLQDYQITKDVFTYGN